MRQVEAAAFYSQITDCNISFLLISVDFPRTAASIAGSHSREIEGETFGAKNVSFSDGYIHDRRLT